MFKFYIGEDTYRVSVDQINEQGNYAILNLNNGHQYYLFEDSTVAGEIAKEYWEDLSEDDPEEFECLVGAHNLISWAKGEYAGPGSTQVDSLSEWFDLWLDTPEEHWASYDGCEREVQIDYCSRVNFAPNGKLKTHKDVVEDIKEILGFYPTVGYRA